MQLRIAQSADVLPIRQLIHRTIAQAYAGVYPPSVIDFFLDYHAAEHIAERLATGTVLVVTRDEEIIATGALVGHEILGVFVAPEEQRHGYGVMMMDALERKALAQGLSEVTLCISLPSKTFYNRLGYEVVEDCAYDVGGGEIMHYWTAHKRLGQG